MSEVLKPVSNRCMIIVIIKSSGSKPHTPKFKSNTCQLNLDKCYGYLSLR